MASFLTACGGQVQLLAEIQEGEANEILTALSDAGLKAYKIPGKEGIVSVTIDQSLVAAALTVLNAEGLPRERHVKMGEVFRKEGLISSPLEERARYLWALSQELSSTIAQIDGVIRARVHVVLPERSVAGEPPIPSSAAVFIKHQRGYNLTEAIPQVKRLVANSIPGLNNEKVSVVLLMAMPKPQPDASQPSPIVKVLGFAVSPGSVNGLQTLLFGLIGALLLALGGAGYLAWRIWGTSLPLPSSLKKVLPKEKVHSKAPAKAASHTAGEARVEV